MHKIITLTFILVLSVVAISAQNTADAEGEAVIQRAITKLGGQKYLNVTTQIGKGRFSTIRDGAIISSQTFIDVIVFPEQERTDFKGGGARSVQTNTGDAGWVFDGEQNLIKEQTPEQVQNYKHGVRVSLDYLLRGHWRKDAKLAYIGKRPATLGKRSDAVKLTFNDGAVVEFEFTAEDALPIKAIYKQTNGDGVETVEEDRYAQFLEYSGIFSPYIIDRFSDGIQVSRINYESIEFNKKIPDSIFTRPTNPKDLKKDLKL